MLTPRFQKMSIQQKLYFLHLLVTAASMLLVFFVVLAYQYISSKHDLQNDLDSQLIVIENNLGAAISFGDKGAAEETLHSLNINPSVEHAYILLNDNTVFAKYLAKNQGGAKANQLIPTVRFPLGDIHLSRKILVNRQQLGTIFLDANLDVINSRIKLFFIALFLAVFVAMLLAKLLLKKLNRFITEPISRLEYFVTEITESKNYTTRCQTQSTDEVGALSIGINKMLDNIESRDKKLLDELEQRRKVEHRLDQLAYLDSLTNLPNRYSFTEDIASLLAQANKNEINLHLLMLDLDNFKVINDTLGHWAGDHLLKESAIRLNESLRKNASIYRIGGDEFAIILMGITTLELVEAICHRIIRTMSEKFVINNHELFVGVSIGVVEYTGGHYNQSSLIKHADAAMYWAKNDGKNTYKIYSNQIEQANFHQQMLIGMLEDSIQNNELELYYQPIIDGQTRRILGFEALLRWNQSEIGFVSPTEFIPLAESSGLIRPIGDWVINKALDQIKLWQTFYYPELFININLSGRQFEDCYLMEKIMYGITRNQLNPATVNLEITESVLMEDIDRAISILNSLHDLGVRIALDDFGTGHSSMNYLKKFPINTLKIDKGFVQGLPDDEMDKAIVESLLTLADGLGLSVVAEGVETEAQLEFMVNHHCYKIQGYLFSPALPIDQIEKLLEQSYDDKRINKTLYCVH